MKPSPGMTWSFMPKSRQRWVTSLSSSSKESSSSSNSIRSRADSLPSLCWRAWRSGPPPRSAASLRRRSSSKRFIRSIVRKSQKPQSKRHKAKVQRESGSGVLRFYRERFSGVRRAERGWVGMAPREPGWRVESGAGAGVGDGWSQGIRRNTHRPDEGFRPAWVTEWFLVDTAVASAWPASAGAKPAGGHSGQLRSAERSKAWHRRAFLPDRDGTQRFCELRRFPVDLALRGHGFRFGVGPGQLRVEGGYGGTRSGGMRGGIVRACAGC